MRACSILSGEKPMPGTMFDGREGGLLDLGEIVLRVAVQLHHADLDQRIVGVRPDLGQVERVVAVFSASASGMICT